MILKSINRNIIKKACAAILTAFIIITVKYFIPIEENNSKPVTKPVVDLVYGLGTVKAEKTYTLRLTVNALLIRVYVLEGEQVKRGEKLILTDSGALLKAPFDGIITSLYYTEGESVGGSQPVLQLVDPSSTYVLLSLDQDSIIKVKKGQSAELSFDTMRERKVKGVVSMVYSSNDEFLVKIKTPALQTEVLPGMTVDTVIAVGHNRSACLVPEKAVINDEVILYGKSGNHKEKVKPGFVDGNWLEISCDKIHENEIIKLTDRKR